MKIVINTCYGGFGISTPVFEWLIKNKGWETTGYNKKGNYEDDSKPIWKGTNTEGKISYHLTEYDRGIRNNLELIDAIEAVGVDKASDSMAKLKIVEIPDDVDYEIDEYDGIESIHEKHRSWY